MLAGCNCVDKFGNSVPPKRQSGNPAQGPVYEIECHEDDAGKEEFLAYLVAKVTGVK